MAAGRRAAAFSRLRGLGRPRPADAVSGAVTGLFSVPEGMAARLAGEGGRLVLCGVQPALVRLLERTGLGRRLGEDGVVPATSAGFGSLDSAYRARRWTAEHEADHEP